MYACAGNPGGGGGSGDASGSEIVTFAPAIGAFPGPTTRPITIVSPGGGANNRVGHSGNSAKYSDASSGGACGVRAGIVTLNFSSAAYRPLWVVHVQLERADRQLRHAQDHLHVRERKPVRRVGLPPDGVPARSRERGGQRAGDRDRQRRRNRRPGERVAETHRDRQVAGDAGGVGPQFGHGPPPVNVADTTGAVVTVSVGSIPTIRARYVSESRYGNCALLQIW